MPSAPEADWAEFFNFSYLLEYVAPILTAYQPGVKLNYFAHTLILEYHDNLKSKTVQKYADSLQLIVDSFLEYTPENLSFSFMKDSDVYSREEYDVAISKGLEQAEQILSAKPKERQEAYLQMSELNIKWDGKNDWTGLSEEEKKAKIKQGALYEAALSTLDKIGDYAKAKENVLVFTNPGPEFIGIGSTYSSIAKFWVGYGVLEEHDTKLVPRVLTPSQLEREKENKLRTEKIDILPLKNLQQVEIFPKLGLQS